MALAITLCGLLIAIGGAAVAIPKIYRACICIASFIVRVNRAIPILDHIASEVRPNGGSSIKDKVNKAADDSAIAVRQNSDIIDRLDSGVRKATEAAELAKGARSDVDKLTSKLENLAKEFHERAGIETRFMKHSVAGDLNQSTLAEELNRLEERDKDKP